MNWIPCKERLPEEGQSVLVTVNSKKRVVHEAVYTGQNKRNHAVWSCPFEYDFKAYWDTEVVAWMPLPKPYKEQEQMMEGNDEGI